MQIYGHWQITKQLLLLLLRQGGQDNFSLVPFSLFRRDNKNEMGKRKRYADDDDGTNDDDDDDDCESRRFVFAIAANSLVRTNFQVERIACVYTCF